MLYFQLLCYIRRIARVTNRTPQCQHVCILIELAEHVRLDRASALLWSDVAHVCLLERQIRRHQLAAHQTSVMLHWRLIYLNQLLLIAQALRRGCVRLLVRFTYHAPIATLSREFTSMRNRTLYEPTYRYNIKSWSNPSRYTSCWGWHCHEMRHPEPSPCHARVLI